MNKNALTKRIKYFFIIKKINNVNECLFDSKLELKLYNTKFHTIKKLYKRIVYYIANQMFVEYFYSKPVHGETNVNERLEKRYPGWMFLVKKG
ncbi:hypothetical protein D0T49_07280 [Paludibacter sp. 221]|nr:hypothetical protein [Paludibacter sp. 221]